MGEKRNLKLLGIPFVWGGENPNTGLDCYTYAQYIRREGNQIELPSTFNYHRYSEDTLPLDYIRGKLDYYAGGIDRTPQTFDLVLLSAIGSPPCLGTVIGDRVYYFSSKGFSTCSSIAALRRWNAIEGFWEFPTKKPLQQESGL